MCFSNSFQTYPLEHDAKNSVDNFQRHYKSAKALLGLLASRKALLLNLPDSKEKDRLAFNIFNLTYKSTRERIVTDDLTGNKYYIQIGGLKGGGGTFSQPSNEEEIYKSTDRKAELYSTINKISLRCGIHRTSLITLDNKCDYPLIHLRHQSESGRFYTKIEKTFGLSQGVDRKIDKNHCGGIVHTSNGEGASSGYVAFMIKVPGKNYVVCLAWDTRVGGKNRAGGEVRAESGALDESSNIIAHSIDPSSSISKISALTDHLHDGHNGPEEFRVASNRVFQIDCLFTNRRQATYDFFITKPTTA